MTQKNEALIHLKYLREMVDDIADKLDAHTRKTDTGITEVRGLAEGAHARITAFENKGHGFRLGTLFGLTAGGSGLGAAIVKWWPFQ